MSIFQLKKSVAVKFASVLVGGAMALTLVFGGAVAPAQAQTVEELTSFLNGLLAQIAELQSQLSDQGIGIEDTPKTISYSFPKNLSPGDSGADVLNLQKVLNMSADTQVATTGVGSTGLESEYFGSLTKAAVIKFQNKYASEILTPLGLTTGTGYINASTRARLNSMAAPTTPTTTFPAGCTSAEGFSPTTGQACLSAGTPTTTTTTFPAGCTSTKGFSATTGQACLGTGTSNINFDDAVMKSSLMIKIFDNSENRFVSSGSGISVGGMGNILTNYHVIEKAILNPNRYNINGCVTISLNSVPECNYSLNLTRNLLSGGTVTAKYDKDLDLALLYIDQVKVNGNWTSILNVSMDDLKDRSIYLSSYTKNYNDLHIGDSVYSIGYPDYGNGTSIQVEGIVTSGPEMFVVKSFGGELSERFVIGSDFGISHGNSGGPVFNPKGELIGMTDACFENSNKKCVKGYFLPLPTVNSWYTKVSDSHIITWQGKSYYSSNNGISDNVQKSALCLLRQNSYYDANTSTDNCICKTGYSKNLDGDCVDSSGTVNPQLRYGQAVDPEKELKALQMLESLFR